VFTSRINILQWILTKLGTYLDLKRIWNPIDFQGQRSRSQGQIFRWGDMPRFALPLLIFIHTEHTFCICPFLVTLYVPSLVKIHWRMLILECSQGLWRTDGSVTISPRNFVGEGITKWWGDMPRFALPLLIFIHTEHTFCICPFLVTFFLATIDDRNLIFGHKLHIGTPYRGKRFNRVPDSPKD
jgi:hypothetical protein